VLKDTARVPKLNAAARQLISSGALAHLVTLNEDGSPQVAIVWMGVDGEDLVCAHLDPSQRKLANLRRDPRVTVSFESDVVGPYGMREYLVVHGTATVTEGGAPELLAQLAKVYIGPDAAFPPMPNPPPGFVTRITINRIHGMGTWSA
jgi:PPOX class probable F420-dependent enzyme